MLNGQKLWTTNAAEADLFIVFANAAPEKRYKGITAFLVERGCSGFRVGKKEDKLGIRASSTCELILEDCVVPAENVLGEEGIGYKVAIETLNEGRIGIGAQMIGLARGPWTMPSPTVVSGRRSANPSASSRESSSRWRKWRRSWRRRDSWSTTPRG